MRLIDAQEFGRERLIDLLGKPSFFDAVDLSPGVKAKIRTVFGADLTAEEVVARIVAAVREKGDAALCEFSRRIDGVALAPEELEVTAAEFAAAEQAAAQSPRVMAAIEKALANVRRFYADQVPVTRLNVGDGGSLIGQKWTPLDRVGIYIPGGTAAYPSSVVMNAAPAAIAGVGEIVAAVPPGRDGRVNPFVLAAARRCGVSRVFKIGGAQAIAALAFGTATVPKVDKIAGPGNIFVTLAKKAVYGYCDIDMLAGPSEVLIIADSTADPSYVAADLLSQAEHDPLARCILLTDDRQLAAAVAEEIKRQLKALPRHEVAGAALGYGGMTIVTGNLAEAAELANVIAPEHLEIMMAEPLKLLPKIRHAGAIFLGPYSPEPVGDYLAGPSHVLPTGGTSRFFSGLGVETFMKRSSVISYTKEALTAVGDDIAALAEAEGLTAHANAVRIRRLL